ncbi:glycosyltransferase family 2 protein [Stutzerimonas nitrititolerans]|uniref:glycosyltransferase family 2 protein n=1 Tax=Stutzerimonas nitrititolerans TaxID=2482751 RepID=UPI00289E5E13|nr:glycosyltransferase [Stutzerimonas nitrititolerans]
MADKGLLSIIVLVYNTEAYLRECFDSLLNQSYKNIEIIAVDDGSIDDSYSICQEYQARYSFFRCIRKVNEGGAVAGNYGLSMARGEYAALVDSDDFVTSDGYSLMMQEALEQKADVVIGRAAYLRSGELSFVDFLYQPFVWKEYRVVNGVREFPDLIHDGFYWNKVFRLAFLREHSLGMEPGLLYADGLFVRQAYWHSQRTVIIPQLVYIWRSRSDEGNTSITQRLTSPEVFRDRLISMRLDWEKLDRFPAADWYKHRVAVCNLQRALLVAHSIIASKALRQVFLESMQELLELYREVDMSALGARRLLYLELIRMGEVAGLCYLLGLPYKDREVWEEDGRIYWKQPFLNNPDFYVDRSVCELKLPVAGFFEISSLLFRADGLYLELSMHESIKRDCEIEFEMQGIFGEGVLLFEEVDSAVPGVYAYSLPFSILESLPKEAVYGLVMNYTFAGVRGYFRVGRGLLDDALISVLPVQSPCGREVFWSAGVGGVGMQKISARKFLE